MSDVKDKLRSLMEEIQDDDHAFSQALFACRGIACESYFLPSVPKEDEGLMINNQPEFVPVTPQNQRGVALANLLDLYAHEGESTRFSSRHPGVIALTGDNSAFLRLEKSSLRATNSRHRFVKASQEIKNKKERFDVIHDLYPYLNMNNLRRHINVFKNVKDIAFSWANKPIVTKPSIIEVESRINRQVESDLMHLDKHEAEQEIEVLRSVRREDDLRYIRPNRVQPIIRLDKVKESCPCPCIVFNESGQAPTIKSLSNYNKAQQKKRGRQVSFSPVIPRLHLFLRDPC